MWPTAKAKAKTSKSHWPKASSATVVNSVPPNAVCTEIVKVTLTTYLTHILSISGSTLGRNVGCNPAQGQEKQNSLSNNSVSI